MKFQYLGTAASEGIPAIFCSCENCARSRKIGGRALRTRSQAIIDDRLLIDFPSDTLAHTFAHNVDLAKVSHCLITHSHSDHLYPADIRNMEFSQSLRESGYHLTFYGTEPVGEHIKPMLAFRLEAAGMCSFRTIENFEQFEVGPYQITALPAIHDPKAGPVFYQISDGEKTILYGNDTGYFDDSVWEFWAKEKPYFNMVSLDCTNACLPFRTPRHHMGFEENVEVRDRMIAEGYADENTVFVCNHFSHNSTNVVYDDLVPLANREGLLVSYDGMVITV